MQEIWKDVPEYEGLYQVSNFGRVKSFRESAKFKKPKELILKSSLINSGYAVVTLYKENSKRKFQIHRLVASVFLPNPLNLPCVNHKDENKLNNCVDNLEWCTYQYNNNYGTARIRAHYSKCEPIIQKTLDGYPLATYQSARIASELLKIKYNKLKNWCNIGFGGGYRWERT